MKKTLALILALLMLAGMSAACGAPAGPPETTTAATTTTAAATEAATTTEATTTTTVATTEAAKTTAATTTKTATTTAATTAATTTAAAAETGDAAGEVTISMYHQLSMTRPFNETAVGQEIKRLTGVNLDVISGNMDKFQVLAAGGDLPDILHLANDNGLIAQALVDSKQVLPLDDLLAQRGQNILKRNTPGIENLRTSIRNGDDKAYFIPTETRELNLESPEYVPWQGVYVRFDLYKQIGAPKVNGEDEFLEMLKLMQDTFPESPLGTKTYALSSFTDWGLWPFYYPFCSMYAHGGGDYYFYNLLTNEMHVTFSDPDSLFWRALDFYFRANQLGIYDPDGLIMSWDQYFPKFQNGEIFSGPATDWEGGPNRQICGEEAMLALIPGAFPCIEQVWSGNSPYGWGFSNSRAISSNAKNPERVMDLLNFFDSDEGSRLLLNGVKGVHWDFVDGEPEPIGEWLEANLGNEELYQLMLERDGITRLQQYSSGKWKCDDGFDNSVGGVKIARLRAAQNPAFAAFADFYGMPGAYPGEVYADWVNKGLAISIYDHARVGDKLKPGTEEVGQLVGMANQYVSSRLGEIILAPDRAAFEATRDRIIAELMDMGYQAAIDEITAHFQEAVEASADDIAYWQKINGTGY